MARERRFIFSARTAGTTQSFRYAMERRKKPRSVSNQIKNLCSKASLRKGGPVS